MTKDEHFLIEIYRCALTRERDLSEAEENGTINPGEIAKKLGFKENLTKEIIKGLRRANLIKVFGPNAIALTRRGEEVARSLLK